MIDKNTKIKATKDRKVIIGLHGEGWDYEFSLPENQTIDMEEMMKLEILFDQYDKFINAVLEEAERNNRNYKKAILHVLDTMPDDYPMKIFVAASWDDLIPTLIQKMCEDDLRLGFSLLVSKLSDDAERKKGLEILRGESLHVSFDDISRMSKIPKEELLKMMCFS